MTSDIELFDADRFAVKSRDDGYYPVILNLQIVPREEWGALPPRTLGEAQGGIVGNIVATLNTDTTPCVNPEECERTVREIQRKQLQQGYSDIQYNFLVGCDGRVYEGRGWYCKSCPKLETPKGLNTEKARLDIAYIGDWRNDLNPAFSMLDPTFTLFMFGMQGNYIEAKYRFFELDKRYVKPEKEPEINDFQ
ncbi:peptidoglycan-recognition protein SB2-like [Macrosteles quadrilineatus]|uniref:peptidoglycan-recognition protein SB2-like n=1 Tax=Macrosteles quadrilineatus TaxID=74068 RepID=UPI0023E0B77B|nr:peptidoglycan-recognition protein SB2-like [Macrosteles quadrilineatus]